MRFQRTIDVQSAVRPSSASGELRRSHRRRAFRRFAFIGLLAVVLVACAVVDRSWVSADGVVSGQLTPVTAISQARIAKLSVKCLDYVSRGQVIGVLENDLTMQAAAQQIQQLQIELAQAHASQEIADTEASAAEKYYEAQIAVRDQLEQVYKAQSEMVQKNYTATLVWQQAKASVAKADAEAQAAQFVVESKKAESKRASLEAKLTEQRIAGFQSSPELMGKYELTAAKAGYLTQCNAAEGNVVNAETALYQIFNPSDAYTVVFVNPSDAASLKTGDRMKVSIGGMKDKVEAQVTGFYPELSGLPVSLTRYFWQQEKWSQYEPIRLDFVNLTDTQQRTLRASAQVSVSLWQSPGHAFAPLALWLSGLLG